MMISTEAWNRMSQSPLRWNGSQEGTAKDNHGSKMILAKQLLIGKDLHVPLAEFAVPYSQRYRGS